MGGGKPPYFHPPPIPATVALTGSGAACKPDYMQIRADSRANGVNPGRSGNGRAGWWEEGSKTLQAQPAFSIFTVFLGFDPKISGVVGVWNYARPKLWGSGQGQREGARSALSMVLGRARFSSSARGPQTNLRCEVRKRIPRVCAAGNF